jgi:SEC-C motif-containing protein
MRSRYSAYALDDTAYVRSSWHPDTRPADIEPEPGLRWTGLDVLATERGGLFDPEGVVEFRAHYIADGHRDELEERSRFVRLDGAWVYWGVQPG